MVERGTLLRKDTARLAAMPTFASLRPCTSPVLGSTTSLGVYKIAHSTSSVVSGLLMLCICKTVKPFRRPTIVSPSLTGFHISIFACKGTTIALSISVRALFGFWGSSVNTASSTGAKLGFTGTSSSSVFTKSFIILIY